MHPVFPFTTQQAEFFAGVMGDVPVEFTIRDLNSPPIPYQPIVAESGRSFTEPMRMAAKHVAASIADLGDQHISRKELARK